MRFFRRSTADRAAVAPARTGGVVIRAFPLASPLASPLPAGEQLGHLRSMLTRNRTLTGMLTRAALDLTG